MPSVKVNNNLQERAEIPQILFLFLHLEVLYNCDLQMYKQVHLFAANINFQHFI